MDDGCFAVAMVQRQVMLVKAINLYSRRDDLLHVHMFVPFGQRTFLLSPVPQARISPRDLLTIFCANDIIAIDAQGAVDLSAKAYAEFVELGKMMQEKYEKMFSAWSRTERKR
ncbi:hypothetical protein QCA50_009155 [Cerrena zonata]|uniref:Uncharacterized protein n=1 Tax=Cerrena zonata TaxID=2478898 RepID=A0AAW0G3R7_9APHY